MPTIPHPIPAKQKKKVLGICDRIKFVFIFQGQKCAKYGTNTPLKKKGKKKRANNNNRPQSWTHTKGKQMYYKWLKYSYLPCKKLCNSQKKKPYKSKLEKIISICKIIKIKIKKKLTTTIKTIENKITKQNVKRIIIIQASNIIPGPPTFFLPFFLSSFLSGQSTVCFMTHHVCALDALLLLLQWVRFNGGTGSLQTISEIDLHHCGTQILLSCLLACKCCWWC